MRGAPDPQLAMLTSLSTEDLIPADHPIRVVVDAVLAELGDVFDVVYAARGPASVPPETLLKATVFMAMHSIHSERTRRYPASSIARPIVAPTAGEI